MRSVAHAGNRGLELSPAALIKTLQRLGHSLNVFVALSVWTFGLLFATLWAVFTILSLPRTWALVSLAVLVSNCTGHVLRQPAVAAGAASRWLA